MSASNANGPPLLFIGAGAHARSLLDALDASANIKGLLSQDGAQWGSRILGATVLGGDDELYLMKPTQVSLVNAVGSVSSTAARRAVFERWRAAQFRFHGLIHKTAYVSETALLGEGTQVLAQAYVGPGAALGDNVLVNTRALLEHGVQVGPHAHVAPGAVLLGEVRIGAGTHVGAGATVLQGVHVGERCVIGAGAVVLHSLLDGQRVAGVPARSL